MKTHRVTPIFVRILVIAALVIPLALSGIPPAKAAVTNTAIFWGDNNGDILDVPAGLYDVTAIAAGNYHNLALKSDGTVIGWGNNILGQINIPAGLNGVTAIAAGGTHSLALKGDGTVVGWGANSSSYVSIPAGLTDVIAISAGYSHSLALKSDGTVVGWGDNYEGQISVPAGLTDVIAISAGGIFSLALKSDGTVVGWGNNTYGQTSIPANLTGVVAISAGYFHSLALKSDGTVVGWGNNAYGQTSIPANLTGVVAISSGYYHSLALKSDGTVVGWGLNVSGQATPPAGLTGVLAISAAHSHNLALVPVNLPGNTAPTANPGGPYLGAANSSINFDGSLSSDPEGDPLTYAWDFGDGNATGTGATPTHTYAAAGVYNVCLTVNDGSAGSDPACTLAVVYDPSAGFVTGGGRIESPAGAYMADPTLAGKATFGFVAKYQKGASVPTGNTAFEFDLAGLAFASQSYDWLVVNQAGSNAQFKGIGLINGLTDPNGNAYKFMLWATDSSPDTFRIRIWWEDAAGENDVYDNGSAQAIGAGNIVVHTSK